MKNEIKIVAGVGLVAGAVAGAYLLNRQKSGCERSKENMLDINGTIEGVRDGNTKAETLLPVEVEKINGMIQGMSEEEIRVVLQNIPVGLMFDEIGARLAMHEQFAMSIQDALKCLPR